MPTNRSAPLRMMVVFPHPDDESLGIGSTLAKYSAEGIDIYLICATRGERGWPEDDISYPGLKELGNIRENELRCAAHVLGLKEVIFLDCIDGEVDKADPLQIEDRIAALIRSVQPQVVITFSPDGIYGHPDHIALSQFTAAAVIRAAQPLGDGHTVSKFYYAVDSKYLVRELQKIAEPITFTVNGVVRSHFGWEDWAVTTQIDARNYIEKTTEAILCHKSQAPGFQDLIDLPRDKLIDLLGYGTFIRVFSLVNGGLAKENDLFAGLR
jgi:LmbE family N-acetylglucosaminyl deacetylase